MKKFKSNLQVISNILTTIGIPLLFIYGFQIHNEQIRMKDQKIETVEAFNETLKYNQINSAMERYRSLRELNLEITNENDAKSIENDSLIKIIRDFKFKDSNGVVYLDRETAMATIKDLMELDLLRKEMKLKTKIDSIKNKN